MGRRPDWGSNARRADRRIRVRSTKSGHSRALFSRTTTGPRSTSFFRYWQPGAEPEARPEVSGQSTNTDGSTTYQIVRAGRRFLVSGRGSRSGLLNDLTADALYDGDSLFVSAASGIFGLARQKLTRIPTIPTSESCPTAAPTIAPMSAYIVNVQRSPIDSQGSVTAQSPATWPGFVVSQYSSRGAAREPPSRDHETVGLLHWRPVIAPMPSRR